MKNWFGRLLTVWLCILLTVGGTVALAEGTTDDTADSTSDTNAVYEDPQALSGEGDTTAESNEIQYIATATVALKVRREPSADSLGNGSISRGDLVNILELGSEWSLVDIGRNVGYVPTKYLSDIHEFSSSTGVGDSATVPQATDDPDATANPDATAASDTPDGFKENFTAYAYITVVARKGMDEHSAATFRILKYEKVTVSSNQDGWSYVRYKNSYGYVPSSSLFKWDRIDPYAGDIPGCIIHMGLAFVNHTTDIRSYVDSGNEVLKTVNPGSALAVEEMDDQGRYPLAYWRTTGYINESDVSYVMKVVPWDEAESGDMISCMSTYYAVGVHTLNYQGRNWNVYLGSSFISGLVLQPGETVNIYDIMGPYRESTGYHRAPIMSPGALSGFGGGTCQVNTTLYNALIQVPIYINWRKVHAQVGIYYCPVGFDAAVGGGDITMIFTNTLPYAFRINYFISDGCLTVGIFKV